MKRGGMLGMSKLFKLCYFDLHKMTQPDIMHICSGVVQRHLLKTVTGKRLAKTLAEEKRKNDPARVLGQGIIDLQKARDEAEEAVRKSTAKRAASHRRDVEIHQAPKAGSKKKDKLVAARSAAFEKEKAEHEKLEGLAADLNRKHTIRVKETCKVSVGRNQSDSSDSDKLSP